MDDNKLPELPQLQRVASDLYDVISPTPQINWPLLSNRLGAQVWIKHENHNPTGSFKVRGGLVYLSRLKAREPSVQGVVAATRGNFGQAVAFAAGRLGLKAVVVVPVGNSEDKNRSMSALGAELIVAGSDFDESAQVAKEIAVRRQLHLMPSFHLDLVAGVASYALELLAAQPNLKRLYVPIGLGSGVCGCIAAREALGLETEIVGVVSELANGYALSFEAGRVCSTNRADTLADGLAVRNPDATVVGLLRQHVQRVVTVSEQEILRAMRIIFEDTHNVAEGAGAAALAALIKEQELNRGESVATIVTGSNVTRDLFGRALAVEG